MARGPAIPLIARRALVGAAGLTALLVLCWYAVFHIAEVQRVDASIYNGFGGLRWRPHVNGLANLIAGSCDPDHYVYLCVIPLAIALARRRFLVAGGIAVILLGANLTTHILKPLLAAPRPAGLPAFLVSEASWPSGHATASMTLALCVVLACPARLRGYAAAIGGAFAVAVSFSFLTLGWHYPSDALAGFLVGAIWTLLGIAGIAVLDERLEHGATPRPVQIVAADAMTPPVAALGLLLALASFVAILRPEAVIDYARLHTSFVVGAAALAALGLSLATGVMLTLRR
jgi:membrane-associated phospholipid phosphatase